jgi:hypothetical protein
MQALVTRIEWADTPGGGKVVYCEAGWPAECELPMSWPLRGVEEGWAELENPREVKRPGGTVENPWAVSHTFTQADAIVIAGADGPVRFVVTENPDVYGELGDPERRVTYAYQCELDGKKKGRRGA